MSMTTTPARVEGTVAAPLAVTAGVPTLGWALRRALLAVLILFVTIACAAWLLYASIDPAEEQGFSSELSAGGDHSVAAQPVTPTAQRA
jgi:hypothetical protein